MCKKYGGGRGCAAAADMRPIQPAKSSLLPLLLLPTLLLLKPLLLLTSQMATLGLTQRLPLLPGLTSQMPGLTSQMLALALVHAQPLARQVQGCHQILRSQQQQRLQQRLQQQQGLC